MDGFLEPPLTRRNLPGLLNKKEKTMNTQDETRDVAHNSAHNPFPEPQTIPSGWDTSAFASASQTASEMEADDSTES